MINEHNMRHRNLLLYLSATVNSHYLSEFYLYAILVGCDMPLLLLPIQPYLSSIANSRWLNESNLIWFDLSLMEYNNVYVHIS